MLENFSREPLRIFILLEGENTLTPSLWTLMFLCASNPKTYTVAFVRALSLRKSVNQSSVPTHTTTSYLVTSTSMLWLCQFTVLNKTLHFKCDNSRFKHVNISLPFGHLEVCAIAWKKLENVINRDAKTSETISTEVGKFTYNPRFPWWLKWSQWHRSI